MSVCVIVAINLCLSYYCYCELLFFFFFDLSQTAAQICLKFCMDVPYVETYIPYMYFSWKFWHNFCNDIHVQHASYMLCKILTNSVHSNCMVISDMSKIMDSTRKNPTKFHNPEFKNSKGSDEYIYYKVAGPQELSLLKKSWNVMFSVELCIS